MTHLGSLSHGIATCEARSGIFIWAWQYWLSSERNVQIVLKESCLSSEMYVQRKMAYDPVPCQSQAAIHRTLPGHLVEDVIFSKILILEYPERHIFFPLTIDGWLCWPQRSCIAAPFQTNSIVHASCAFRPKCLPKQPLLPFLVLCYLWGPTAIQSIKCIMSLYLFLSGLILTNEVMSSSFVLEQLIPCYGGQPIPQRVEPLEQKIHWGGIQRDFYPEGHFERQMAFVYCWAKHSQT